MCSALKPKGFLGNMGIEMGSAGIDNRTPMKLDTGHKGLLSSLLPMLLTKKKKNCFALPVKLVGRRCCDDVTKPATILIAKSFNSIQTDNVLGYYVYGCQRELLLADFGDLFSQ